MEVMKIDAPKTGNPPWEREEVLGVLCMEASSQQVDWVLMGLLGWQARANPVYRDFLTGMGVDPAGARNWRDFPALPAASFRDLAVTCFPPEEAKAVFHTSGTTSEETGRHYFQTLEFYHQAARAAFRHFLPDLSGHEWVSLIPRAADRPFASLSHMVETLAGEIAGGRVGWCVDGEYRIDPARLASALENADRPVALFGTSFALAEAAELLLTGGSRVLPEGSVIFDTGGFKGRRRELDRGEFLALLQECWGVAPSAVWNEYGMTELSSQAYACGDERVHRFPSWVRVRLIDPVSGRDVERGAAGLLHIYDVANIGSVAAVATRDLGVGEDGGIRLLGRLTGAGARGCSLPYERVEAWGQ